jgi:hypothetical protein
MATRAGGAAAVPGYQLDNGQGPQRRALRLSG